jgi:hypothetical protein
MAVLLQALGESSKRASINYPQLLGKTVLINTPSYLRYIFHGFSAFMPQSFIDKVTVIPARFGHTHVRHILVANNKGVAWWSMACHCNRQTD